MNHVLQHEIDLLFAGFIRAHPPGSDGPDWAAIGVSFVRCAIGVLCTLPRDVKGDPLLLEFVRLMLRRIKIEP